MSSVLTICSRHLPAIFRKYKLCLPFRTYITSTSDNEQNVIWPPFRYAFNWPDRICLEDEYGQYTYRDIFNSGNQLAEQITKQLDGKVQERVTFLCPNNASYLVTQWACWISGQIAVPLNPAHPSSMLDYFINDSSSALLITVPEYVNKLESRKSHGTFKLIVLEESLYKDIAKRACLESKKAPRGPPPSALKGGLNPTVYYKQNALIIYTSGSTGPPKGVVLSFRNIFAQTTSLIRAWEWTENDTILHALPLHHMHGIVNALLCPIQCGARCIMLPKFDVATVWRYLLGTEQAKVNIFMGVPTMYVKLIEEYDKNINGGSITANYVKATCRQNIRLMVSGSAPLPLPVFNRWHEVTNHHLLERYGMSEIGMALSNPLNGKRKPGYVGTPLPGVSVRIVEGKTVLAEGTEYGTTCMFKDNSCIGELQVKGDNVFVEYWNKPEATAKEFTGDRWFKTGDSAQYIDKSYKILGRLSVDIIKSGGYKISALFVETVLLEHSEIVDISVVGLPDYTWGQKVVAVIVTKNGKYLTVSVLKEWAKEKLPSYCVPSTVKCVPVIPRNLMGKVNKVELIKQLFPTETANSVWNK